jgi:serine/threonine-protein kinase RsbW
MGTPLTFRFEDLSTVTDQVQASFASLLTEAPDEHADALLHLQLAVHEWVANLVQHARFGSDDTFVELVIVREADGFFCTVTDGSSGFDLDEQLEIRRAKLAALPERGMGLLMVFACATDLSYQRNGVGNRLAFRVLDDGGDRCLTIPF